MKKKPKLWPIDAPGIPPIGPVLQQCAWDAAGIDIPNRLKARACKLLRGPKQRERLMELPPGPALLQQLTLLLPDEPFVRKAHHKFNWYVAEVLRRVLYSTGNYHIPVAYKTTLKPMPVVTGHRWGDPYGKCQGPRPSRVMVIGQMLGEEEAISKRHMIGPSGQLLLEVCRQLRIADIQDWYVTTLLKTAHPAAEQGNTDIPVSMLKEWLPILHHEIRLVQPEFILCLGATTCQAVFGYDTRGIAMKDKPTVGKLRGRILDWTYCPAKYVAEGCEGELPLRTVLSMASPHPATVLYQPETKTTFVQGISQFAALTRGIRCDEDEKGLDYQVVTSLPELLQLEETIHNECPDNLLAIDCEWEGHHPDNDGSYLRTIQLSWKHKGAACIRLRAQGGKWDIAGAGQPEVAAIITRICRGKRLAGHFFASDLEWLVPFGVDIRKDFEALPSWEEYRAAWNDQQPCGFDTALAAHAVEETDDFSLTAQLLQHTTIPRYDQHVDAWVKQHCAELRISKAELPGYGECPDEKLIPYSNCDVDGTRRLAVVYSKLLLSDRHGNDCWQPFWISMRAMPAALEMTCEGITIDRDRVDQLTEDYLVARKKLEARIREWARWPEFNVNSVNQVCEFLFGEKYNKFRDKDNQPIRKRPPGGRSLKLTPLVTTDKHPMQWSEVVEKGLEDEKAPSTNKITLAILAQEAQEVKRWHPGLQREVKYDFSDQVLWIRDYRFISQVVKQVLRPPITHDAETLDGLWQQDLQQFDSSQFVRQDGNYIYSAGLPAAICSDGKVRSHFYQDKDTGRWSSARPPLQNITKRREVDYRRILGDQYRWPIRSILQADPGCVLIEADYEGAELFGMGILAGDEQLMADYAAGADIHSQIAVLAFKLDCPATKAGLKAMTNPKNPSDPGGLSYLRDVAKSVMFGLAYGRGAKAIAWAVREQGIKITVAEAQQVCYTIFAKYRKLEPFFAKCAARPKSPSWLCGIFGRRRRFPITADSRKLNDYGRQAMNFPIQNLVADAMSQGLDHLLRTRREVPTCPEFQLVLQVHDAVILQTPIQCIPALVRNVLPDCLVRKVPLNPTTLDGEPLPRGPYYLHVGIDVFQRWGEPMTAETAARLEIPDDCRSTVYKGDAQCGT